MDAEDDSYNLLETWQGQSWTPTDESGGAGWGPVSCLSTTFCAATEAGVAVTGDDGLIWTDGSWTASPFPSGGPYAAGWSISQLACASTSFCVAVGDTEDASGTGGTAALATWAG